MNGQIERRKSEALSSSPGRKASGLSKAFQGLLRIIRPSEKSD